MKNSKEVEVSTIKQSNVFSGEPKLKLDVMEKIYLALSVKSVKEMIFIYTLVSLRSGRNYNVFPTTEIATFDNKKDASIYHKTIEEVMRFQGKYIGVQKIREMMTEQIKEFNERVR